MKVIIVNTSEKTGGAAVASRRLMDALNNNGVKAMMLVRDKETERVTVSALPGRRLQQWNFYWERLVIFLRNLLHSVDNSGMISSSEKSTDCIKRT